MFKMPFEITTDNSEFLGIKKLPEIGQPSFIYYKILLLF